MELEVPGLLRGKQHGNNSERVAKMALRCVDFCLVSCMARRL